MVVTEACMSLDIICRHGYVCAVKDKGSVSYLKVTILVVGSDISKHMRPTIQTWQQHIGFMYLSYRMI